MKKINLSIPKPCNEDWNKMTLGDKGRFCASCQKSVIDFTSMSDRQVVEFFKKTSSSVCGRFYQDQLNRDIEFSRKRIPWIKYFFQFTLPAFLISMKATAQKNRTLIGDTIYCTSTMGFVTGKLAPEKSADSGIISGQIVDDKGNKISFASVMIKNTKTETLADANGNFKLNAHLNSTLVFSAVGYNSKEIVLNGKTQNLTVVFETKDVALSGAIVVVGYTRRKKNKPISSTRKVLDTAFKKFSVYPNPVQRNSSVKIDFKKLGEGTYVVSLMNMNGEVAQTEDIVIERKKEVIDFRLKDVAAGTYFVHLLSRKTTASYSEKIIVQ
jgi:hypothetical protein